jgi:hypothetical protein
MSTPLGFLRPLRYDRVRTVLVVQTGDAALLAGVVARVQELFPGCSVDVLVREADAAAGRALDVAHCEVARWEERFDLLARLRRKRFDATVLQLGGEATTELRLLPFLVRTRYLIAFNDRLDYFPLNVFRLTALAHHFALTSGEGGFASALLWFVRRTLVAAVAGVVGSVWLLVSVGWIHARGALRRRRRARRAPALERRGARVA